VDMFLLSHSILPLLLRVRMRPSLIAVAANDQRLRLCSNPPEFNTPRRANNLFLENGFQMTIRSG